MLWIVLGALMVGVGIWMRADGTWMMTDEEYHAKIGARKKARAAKAANGAKRSG